MEIRETTHKPGNLSCLEVRDVLSDVIDARRGEIPHPDGTRLAESGMRAAVELHLAGCGECRDELHCLEQSSDAFVDFAVGELPAQYFEDFGSKVRERLKREQHAARAEVSSARARFSGVHWKRTLAFALSGLAAACVAFIVSGRFVRAPKSGRNKVQAEVAEAPKLPVEPTPRIREIDKLPILGDLSHAPGGVMDVFVQAPQPGGTRPIAPSRLPKYDPQVPTAMKDLQSAEGQFGSLICIEHTNENEPPKLGISLKTTRDVDREVIGLMVWDVMAGSPAQSMGLQKGDFIVDVNREKVNGGAEEAARFFLCLKKAKTGTRVRFLVVRFTELGPLCKPLYGTLGKGNDPEPNVPSWHF